MNLTAHWVNADSSNPETFIGLIDGVLVLTGDNDKFSNAFGPTRWLTLRLVYA
ncbi:hypothetical protein BDQ12DRAFT_725722 [Crucibulum laeve]|uniref:Uncharacterized protein n=1 Tax=Crucibulum laeve TaxID=68775 RepID=A0A5C3LS96_9AGAR|nr:hypothetical protein BDQ12DRAFT_725722 [Crucibulum laeve]